ncbi:hypothetical protein DZD52_02940 [Xanthomonas nasturtii]|uniref:Uncharacterized protein n=1 Tax=Xanthomonas nasturtii TaxID=1843581 RepID=A0A3E1KQR1_9XANT|nr:hypothetical protein DZD52_02940 [Xanthomonas nasturtii]
MNWLEKKFLRCELTAKAACLSPILQGRSILGRAEHGLLHLNLPTLIITRAHTPLDRLHRLPSTHQLSHKYLDSAWNMFMR